MIRVNSWISVYTLVLSSVPPLSKYIARLTCMCYALSFASTRNTSTSISILPRPRYRASEYHVIEARKTDRISYIYAIAISFSGRVHRICVVRDSIYSTRLLGRRLSASSQSNMHTQSISASICVSLCIIFGTAIFMIDPATDCCCHIFLAYW